MLSFAPVWAQEASPQTVAKRQIGKVCKAETARFCPALNEGTPTPRNQAICLRPYKMNLSLGCRNAVTTVMQ